MRAPDTLDPDDPDRPLNVRRNAAGNPVKDVAHTLAGVASILRGVPRRARLGEVDLPDLAAMRALADTLDEALAETVGVLLTQGFSYGDVGRALGVTRQAARQTYGPKAAPFRLCAACGTTPAASGDRYCVGCGSARDRSGWAE